MFYCANYQLIVPTQYRRVRQGGGAVLEELAETGTARWLAEGVVHDGVCLTTVRRAEGVAKREELAVKRPVLPRFRLLTEGPSLLPAGYRGQLL